MLKKDFDIVYQGNLNRTFHLKVNLLNSGMYGVRVSDNTANKDFLIIQLLDFIFSANKNKNPNSELLVPSGVNVSDIGMVISKIKNNLL